LRRNEFHNGMIKFRSLPSVNAFLRSCIPIEGLRNIIRQIAHIASPPVPVVKEGNIGIDIGPTPSATGNDLILNDGNWVVDIME
jgi:hypothetical protein